MEVLSQFPVYLSGGLGVNDENVILIKYIYLNMYTYPQFACLFAFVLIVLFIYWGVYTFLQTTNLQNYRAHGFFFRFRCVTETLSTHMTNTVLHI